MKLYKITRTDEHKRRTNYDIYRGAVVAAEDMRVAQQMHPSDGSLEGSETWTSDYSLWVPEKLYVQVEWLADAPHILERKVILTDFNAG